MLTFATGASNRAGGRPRRGDTERHRRVWKSIQIMQRPLSYRIPTHES